MAGEDYRVKHNGIEMNISKYIRTNKAERGLAKFSKLVVKYNLEDIQNNNNIISFSYNGEQYYYALVQHKIRKKGDKTWFTKVSDILKTKQK